MEGKTSNNIVDLFGLSSKNFTVTEKEEEFVRTGSDLEDVDDLDSQAALVKEVEDYDQGEVEPPVASEKQAQRVDEEQADASENGSNEYLIQTLIDNDILSYDEEKEYSMDDEGLKELILENRIKDRELGEKAFIERLSKDDETRELLAVIQSGGTVRDFLAMKDEVDFTTISLYDNEGNPMERNMTYLIEDWLNLQGFDQDDIQDEIEAYKESNLLEKKAKIAQKAMINNQVREKEARLKEIEYEAQRVSERNAIEAEKFRNKVVNLNEIKGFKLSKKEAEGLYDFMTKADKDGKTEFIKRDTEDTRLLYAYFAYNNFNKDKLSTEIKTEAARAIKKKVSQFQDSNANPRRSSGDATRSTSDSPLKGVSWLGR